MAVLACLLVSGIFAAGATENSGAASRSPAAKTAKRLGLGTRKAATLMLNGDFPDSWGRAVGQDAPPKYLQWPLPGHRLGRGFGSNDGKHLAVDVSADVGTPVHAMAPGIVGYADSGVRGYGNMAMIIHSGGWVTLYAHLSRFKVAPGQRVDRNQVIALSGNTGISRGPHLHFALIVRGKPVDPMRFMRGAPGQKPLISKLFKFPFPIGFLSTRS